MDSRGILPNVKGADHVLNQIFVEHPQPMWIYKIDDFGIIAVNQAAIDAYGYSGEEFLHPGLPTHPNHNIAASQMSGFGGMLSFELDVDSEKLIIFLKTLSLIQPALSLGGVESLICSPAATSHKGLTQRERLSLGIKDNLLRLSVGIENGDDLIADLKSAILKVI